MKKTNIVIGITSGIAAYKTIELIKLFKRNGDNVFVVMTKHATQMISPKEFERVSDKVYIDLFEKGFDYKNILKIRKVTHVDLADKADIIIVAPATANIIAKMSIGIADDFLTTMLLATRSPILVCPSMNVHMWEHPTVQENIQILQSRGVTIIDPEEGDLACGYRGKGRLAHIDHIYETAAKLLKEKTLLSGKKILVTAGATIEPIDDVRFITNKSSGKMGRALAEIAYHKGADVLFLRSTSAVEAKSYISEETFMSADELSQLLKLHAKNFHLLFHAAAVGDFKTRKISGKIDSEKTLFLKLTPREKIASFVKRVNPKIKLVVFKAVYKLPRGKLIYEGKKKLRELRADVVVVNDVGKKDRGFGVDTNEAWLVYASEEVEHIPLQSKAKVAEVIIKNLIKHEIL